jgi:hypothetical protein
MRNGNLLLALLIEIVMLVAFCAAGWSVPGALWLKIVLAVALPGLAIVAWGLWAAPKAGERRLKMPALIYFKAVMFGLAVVAFWFAGQGFIGTVFAVLAAINLVAAITFRQV